MILDVKMSILDFIDFWNYLSNRKMALKNDIVEKVLSHIIIL